MNKIVNNLAQIVDAAEYFDKKTGAAWKIRSSLTNMVVWGCNAHLYAIKSGNAERIARSMAVVATLRTWVHDSNCNSFALDLTPDAIKRTLGLERVVDVHEEAVRAARQKCIQTRSALKFKKFYDAAISAFEEQRKTRLEAVEAIAELISDTSFVLSHEVADYFETFLNMKVGSELADSDLYDEAAVERQADQLAETLGNALEAMYDVCETELAAAITADKVNRLAGYHRAIMNMLVITGVDMAKLAQRRAKLDQLIDEQVNAVGQSVAEIDAEIAKQMHQDVTIDDVIEILAANKPKRQRQRVKKADSLKQLGALVAS